MEDDRIQVTFYLGNDQYLTLRYQRSEFALQTWPEKICVNIRPGANTEVATISLTVVGCPDSVPGIVTDGAVGKFEIATASVVWWTVSEGNMCSPFPLIHG